MRGSEPDSPLTFTDFVAYTERHEGRFEYVDGRIVELCRVRDMPEFEEYLLVDSTQRWVRLYRRTADGGFNYDFDLIAGSVRLHAIGYTLDIDSLYRESGVTF
jgi:hypothetical protein